MRYLFQLIFLIALPINCAATNKICLNMIVKDEAPVIERCLSSIKSMIDYWVIVDTGSTDSTQEVIKKTLSDIPGELHERVWVNFAHNRNEALKLAKNKGDFLLFIDADERLVFSTHFDRSKLDRDCYYSFVRVYDSENPDRYLQGQRVLLANNRLNWTWQGPLHEYLTCQQEFKSECLTQMTIFADSNEGHRSQDPQKNLNDAKLLEEALQEDPANSRLLYYLAQTYESGKQYQHALKSYEKRASIEGCEQEVFWSLFRIGYIQETLHMPSETIINSYSKAFLNRASRLEPLYYMALQYAQMGNSVLAYALLKSGLSFGPCTDQTVHETWIYDYGFLFEFAKSAREIGRIEEARDAWKKLLSISKLPESLLSEARNALTAAPRVSTTSSIPKLEAGQNIEDYYAAFKACSTCAKPLFYLADHFEKKHNPILTYALAKTGAAIAMPDQFHPKERWIYEYAFLDQWGNAAYALQKFSESIEVFKTLLAKKNIPLEVQVNAERKIFSAKKIIQDLQRHGLPSF